jgi:DNA-binding transcriptional LysR family regulator
MCSPSAYGALSAIESATERLAAGRRQQPLRALGPQLRQPLADARAARISPAFPDIALNLSAAHTLSDFALGQADIDIRYGVPTWGDLVVEPLFEERIVPRARPAFIKEHGLKRLEQLADVPLIQSNVSVVQGSDWFSAFTNLEGARNGRVSRDPDDLAAHETIHASGRSGGFWPKAVTRPRSPTP